MTKWVGLEVDTTDLAAAVADWVEGDFRFAVDFILEIDALVADVDFTAALIERLQESLDLAYEAE